MWIINQGVEKLCDRILDGTSIVDEEYVTCGTGDDIGSFYYDFGKWLDDKIPANQKLVSGQNAANPLVAILYRVILPIGVLIGLVAIIAAGYRFMVSQGNPDKVKAASEQLTSAITGVVFIALSLGLLQFIMRSLF